MMAARAAGKKVPRMKVYAAKTGPFGFKGLPDKSILPIDG